MSSNSQTISGIMNNPHPQCFWGNLIHTPVSILEKSEHFFELFVMWLKESKILEQEKPLYVFKKRHSKNRSKGGAGNNEGIQATIEMLRTRMKGGFASLSTSGPSFGGSLMSPKSSSSKVQFRISEGVFVNVVEIGLRVLAEINPSSQILASAKSTNQQQLQSQTQVQLPPSSGRLLVRTLFEFNVLDCFDILDVNEEGFIPPESLFLFLCILTSRRIFRLTLFFQTFSVTLFELLCKCNSFLQQNRKIMKTLSPDVFRYLGHVSGFSDFQLTKMLNQKNLLREKLFHFKQFEEAYSMLFKDHDNLINTPTPSISISNLKISNLSNAKNSTQNLDNLNDGEDECVDENVNTSNVPSATSKTGLNLNEMTNMNGNADGEIASNVNMSMHLMLTVSPASVSTPIAPNLTSLAFQLQEREKDKFGSNSPTTGIPDIRFTDSSEEAPIENPASSPKKRTALKKTQNLFVEIKPEEENNEPSSTTNSTGGPIKLTPQFQIKNQMETPMQSPTFSSPTSTSSQASACSHHSTASSTSNRNFKSHTSSDTSVLSGVVIPLHIKKEDKEKHPPKEPSINNHSTSAEKLVENNENLNTSNEYPKSNQDNAASGASPFRTHNNLPSTDQNVSVFSKFNGLPSTPNNENVTPTSSGTTRKPLPATPNRPKSELSPAPSPIDKNPYIEKETQGIKERRFSGSSSTSSTSGKYKISVETHETFSNHSQKMSSKEPCLSDNQHDMVTPFADDDEKSSGKGKNSSIKVVHVEGDEHNPLQFSPKAHNTSADGDEVTATVEIYPSSQKSSPQKKRNHNGGIGGWLFHRGRRKGQVVPTPAIESKKSTCVIL